MASPQKENGYTPIANELLEAFARIRIRGETRQVIDIILRKTYGFRKKADKISLSQFVLGTGLKKPTVCKALKNALKMNIITQKDNGNSKEYSIYKDFECWKPLPKKITITQKDNASLPKKIHTKETTTKESIYMKKDFSYDEDGSILEDKETKQRKELMAQFNAFLEEYKNGFEKNVGNKRPRYTIPAVRRAYNKAIDMGYTSEELSEKLKVFFITDFYESTNWSPLTFLGEKVLNQLKN